jgi:peptide/nickel transport system substrate-binding protein
VLNLSACKQRRNAPKWCDETYTKIAEEQARTVDPKKRHELVWKAQEYFHEKLPWWMVAHRAAGILYNSDRWENVTSPEPVPPHETVLDPWLKMRPKGDDRIVDWAYYEDVSTYNPIAEQTSQGWMRFVYDPYFRTEGSKIIPWAATSSKIVDDTTVELKLRDGMTFHDGKPVTADDAVFSINMMVKVKPPVLANGLVGITSAEKVDNLTFRIKLAQPNPAILRQLTALMILPKHIWEKVDDPLHWDPIPNKAVIGSGPFSFVRWDRNQVHVLKTYKKHWAAPAYDGLRRLSLGQADAIRAAMVDGTADVATSVLPVATEKELADANKYLGFVRVPTFNTTTVWMNDTKAPFTDLQFRKALRFATDKDRVALEGWLGFADPADEGNVPTALGDWHNSKLKKIPFDLKKARQTLKDAGYGWDSNGRLHFPPDKG